MDGIATTSLVTWLASINPQVQGAAISAIATIVGVVSTASVGFAGFKHARRVAETTLDGQRQRSVDERRFLVYEDAVKYLLRLNQLRPASYYMWSEMSDRPPEPEVPAEEQAEIEARIVAWASDAIRRLWEEMTAVEHGVEVGRQHLGFMQGKTELVPANPVSSEEIERIGNLINDSTNDAYRRRQAAIEAIRKELVGPKPSV